MEATAWRRSRKIHSTGFNRRHLATLQAVFERPTRAAVPWRDIESLFAALGAVIMEGRGPRVNIALGDRVAVFHRPPPRPDTGKATLKDVRRFLQEVGIEL